MRRDKSQRGFYTCGKEPKTLGPKAMNFWGRKARGGEERDPWEAAVCPTSEVPADLFRSDFALSQQRSMGCWPASGFDGALAALPEQGHGPVQPEAAQKVRVSPHDSAAAAPASLRYFFRFSFMSFLFFISLFFFFLFCLGSCLASNFLFLSLEEKNGSR